MKFEEFFNKIFINKLCETLGKKVGKFDKQNKVKWWQKRIQLKKNNKIESSGFHFSVKNTFLSVDRNFTEHFQMPNG